MPDYDVIVIGGGPAGATVSTLLAQRGVRVALYERERFPRFHIGESLIPETYWVLQRLNMLPKMKASPFVKKYSVQFVNASGRLSAPFYFHDNKPHECSQTWQVVRSEFDQMMLQNAREHGVEADEGVHVLEVLFDGNRAPASRFAMPRANDEKSARRSSSMPAARPPCCRIDSGCGSGIRAQQGRHLDLLEGRLSGYRAGRRRDDGHSDQQSERLVLVHPQHDDIVSVGVVAPFDYLLIRPRCATDMSRPIRRRSSAAMPSKAHQRRGRVAGYFATRTTHALDRRCRRRMGPRR
jgi:hypothetical protein